MKLKGTVQIVSLCVALQVIQSYFPIILYGQVFLPSLASSLLTLPLCLLGLILHMFSHAGWAHLFSNMFLGIPCMVYLEKKLGRVKLLNCYVLCGITAAITQSLMPFTGSGLIGASGAIFGLFALCCALFGKSMSGALLGAIMLALAIIPQMQYLNLGPLGGGIAFGAHIGGMVCGLVLAVNILKSR